MNRINKNDIIVVKVGTSTLTYKNGKPNLRRMEELAKVISDLQNSGKKMILVSSGAIGVGMGKVGLETRPSDTAKKQALAAIGQCELMFMYDKFFSQFNVVVAQVLLTGDVVHSETGVKNVKNTFSELLSMNIVPIVNENDTVATYELEGKNIGDNDTLSAIVAKLVKADMLVMLTDIDAMYDGDPKVKKDAKRIAFVEKIDESIEALATGAGSSLGTGGMITKINAAKIATAKGITTCIINGDNPYNIYDLLEGKDLGTVFKEVDTNE